jgi:hypothetical protein
MNTRDNNSGTVTLGLVAVGFLTAVGAAQIGEKGHFGVSAVSPVKVPASSELRLAAPVTGTVVLDFEDLPPANVGRLPSGYAGLEWDSFDDGDFPWWDWSSESVDPPYSQPHSGDNYLFNAFGANNLGFSLPAATDRLVGAWFAKTTGSGGTPNQIRFNGYDAGHVLIEQSAWLTIASTPRYLEANFEPVARLEVQHSSSGGAAYTMDDLTYQTGEAGQSPPAPTDPTPTDAAENVPVDICLSWGPGPLTASPAVALLNVPANALEEEQKNRGDLETVAANPAQAGSAVTPAVSAAPAETEDVVGSVLLLGGGSGDGVGNFYAVTTDVQLVEIEKRLNIPDPMTLRYFVYESSSKTGTYSKIFEKELTGAGTGVQWYSSGAISVPLLAEKFYFVGVSWQGLANYYYDFSAPNAVSFGTQLSGSHRSYPPTNTKAFSDNQIAYYQRLTTSAAAAPSPAASWDLYFGTNPEELELVATDLDQPTYCPGCLETWTKYYWRVVAKNAFGQKNGPLWSFTAVSPVDLNHDGVVDIGDLDIFLDRWLQEVLAP